ncbi:MAG: site-specific integrase [Pseudomonadota bacterium]|nr:site-specific integrase [Pseudomonadota bacterium]
MTPGLDAQLDTPRVYRRERLPRALPWETVQALLRSIDRKTPLGRRDYAIFLLIATYGLRACEVVDLTLDDIDWRGNILRISQRKTRSPLLLPLLNSVGNALVDYLRRARPSLPYREVFLRARAPAGTLKPTAVTEAFQGWSKRSDLNIPFQGAHCLRHAYATHLLRCGIPLKTIGDILGHRSAESTCVYLQLALEDLRDVALSLPGNVERSDSEQGARP